MKYIANSKNGIPVYDRHKSHVHGDIIPLIKEVIENYDLENDIEKVVKEYEEHIGLTHCVRIKPGDEIYYKRRPGRKGLSKFVKNRKPEPCKTLTVILKKMEEDNGYVILTAFVGKPAEPEPWDTKAFQRDPRGYTEAMIASVKFWEEHALIEE